MYQLYKLADRSARVTLWTMGQWSRWPIRDVMDEITAGRVTWHGKTLEFIGFHKDEPLYGIPHVCGGYAILETAWAFDERFQALISRYDVPIVSDSPCCLIALPSAPDRRTRFLRALRRLTREETS